MAQRLPRSVWVMGTRTKIRRHETVYPNAKNEDDDDGSFASRKGITVARGAVHQGQTLLHEILHVIEYEAGIPLSESAVTALAACLYDTLFAEPRNSAVLSFLTKSPA